MATNPECRLCTTPFTQGTVWAALFSGLLSVVFYPPIQAYDVDESTFQEELNKEGHPAKKLSLFSNTMCFMLMVVSSERYILSRHFLVAWTANREPAIIAAFAFQIIACASTAILMLTSLGEARRRRFEFRTAQVIVERLRVG